MFTSRDKDLQYAWHSIHDFFDGYHLSFAVEEMERIIKAAARYKAWNLEYPYRPVHFMEHLQQLVTGAYCITKTHLTCKDGLVTATTPTGEPDLLIKNDFIPSGRYSNIWNCMPRYLTAAQYMRPWKAIKKFTEYATETEWLTACKDLAEYALSNTSIDEEYPCHKLLPIRLHLLRLIEACHLLEVRSNAAKPQPKSPKKK